MHVYDVVIIGSGIVGSMTAMNLSKYDLDILVVDKTYDVGEGSTKANSGVLYPGFHNKGGSLKGVSCVEGHKMYADICKRLCVPVKEVGSLYCSFGENGHKRLMEKYERGLKNGTPDLKIISGDEARKIEPNLSKKVIEALYTPFTGIISPFELVVNAATFAAENNVNFSFETEVLNIETDGKDAVIFTNKGKIFSKFVVNTAGEGADVIESMVTKQNLVIKPRRGQFYIFDKQDEKSPLISHVIYQSQEKDEKGTLIAPTIDGNIIAGPTSENVKDFSRTDTTKKGLLHVEKVAKKIIPSLDMTKVIANFAGVRANIKNVEKEKKDFVIRKTNSFMVSALGIKNPGMTSSPYLAKKIEENLIDMGLKTKKNKNYKDHIKIYRPFLQESEENQKILYKKDKRYARVICRCEKITEGDIISCINSKIPPRSLNGLKKRLRVTMGRCSGSFCTAKIVEIYCREKNIKPWEFMKSEDKSPIVKGYVR